MVTQPVLQEWVLLSYRVPREPSTPRIAIWRRLKKHGALQVGDGLVALPADARTKEHLEWVASMVDEAGGEAIVWTARTTKHQDADLVGRMNRERDSEYAALLAEVTAAATDPGEPSTRTRNRLRREWRRIDRRDYFRSPKRDETRLALQALANEAGTDSAADTNAADR